MNENDEKKREEYGDSRRSACRFSPCAGSPWLAGVLAVAELVLGFVLLGYPLLVGTTVIRVAGFVLVAAAVARLVQCLLQPANRLWNALAFAVYLCLGVLMLMYTGASMEWWTLLIGAALLVGGAFRLLMALVLLREPGSAWRFFNALISLVLGTLVVMGWPGSSLWLLGTIVAVEMIFSGWSLLFLALSPRTDTEC